MRKIYLGLLIFLAIPFLSQIVCAQNADQKKNKVASFKGKIIRSDTNQGVAGVKLLLMDGNKSGNQDNSARAETDKEGNFVFGELKPGKYTLSIRAYFDREEDVPCQLLMGKINEPNSKLVVATENGKKVEHIFVEGFTVKAGKEISKNFDLVCKNLFSK